MRSGTVDHQHLSAKESAFLSHSRESRERIFTAAELAEYRKVGSGIRKSRELWQALSAVAAISTAIAAGNLVAGAGLFAAMYFAAKKIHAIRVDQLAIGHHPFAEQVSFYLLDSLGMTGVGEAALIDQAGVRLNDDPKGVNKIEAFFNEAIIQGARIESERDDFFNALENALAATKSVRAKPSEFELDVTPAQSLEKNSKNTIKY